MPASSHNPCKYTREICIVTEVGGVNTQFGIPESGASAVNELSDPGCAGGINALDRAAQWRRDRWFFLGKERTITAPPIPEGWEWSVPEKAAELAGKEIKHVVNGSREVSPCWRAPTLSAQMRVRWLPDSARPKNTPAYLLVDFRQYDPVTEGALNQMVEVPAPTDPPDDLWDNNPVAWQAAYEARVWAWEVAYGQSQELFNRLWTPLKKTTIWVWLDHAHNPYKAIR